MGETRFVGEFELPAAAEEGYGRLRPSPDRSSTCSAVLVCGMGAGKALKRSSCGCSELEERLRASLRDVFLSVVQETGCE